MADVKKKSGFFNKTPSEIPRFRWDGFIAENEKTLVFIPE